MAEADNMSQKALELGVPRSSIIIEKSSQNTIENIISKYKRARRASALRAVDLPQAR